MGFPAILVTHAFLLPRGCQGSQKKSVACEGFVSVGTDVVRCHRSPGRAAGPARGRKPRLLTARQAGPPAPPRDGRLLLPCLAVGFSVSVSVLDACQPRAQHGNLQSRRPGCPVLRVDVNAHTVARGRRAVLRDPRRPGPHTQSHPHPHGAVPATRLHTAHSWTGPACRPPAPPHTRAHSHMRVHTPPRSHGWSHVC